MSLSSPSYVSPTTGSDHATRGPACSTETATRASRTTPTLCVLVMATGPVSVPDSRTHSRPVSSPLPLRRWQPAKTGECVPSGSGGTTTVTPVRIGPWPTTSGPSPSTIVAWPTLTPGTSVIALRGPGTAAPDGDAEVTRPHRSMLAAPAGHRSVSSSAGRPRGNDWFGAVVRRRTISRCVLRAARCVLRGPARGGPGERPAVSSGGR